MVPDQGEIVLGETHFYGLQKTVLFFLFRFRLFPLDGYKKLLF